MAAFTTSLKDGSVTTRFLPQELVNGIIDYHDPQIHAHHRILTSCSQVCHGFSVRSRELLFAKIQLKYQPLELGGSQVARFARLLNRSPHLGLYVKRLTLNICGQAIFCSAETKLGDRFLSEIFQRLKRLKSLLINPNHDGYLSQALYSGGVVNFDPTIFCQLQSLRSLEIYDAYCTFPKPPQSESLTPVRLEGLKIFLSPCVNSGLDDWIFNTPSVIDVSGLRSLCIPDPKVELLEHYSRLFHLCSMRLEILDIELDGKSLLLFLTNLLPLLTCL